MSAPRRATARTRRRDGFVARVDWRAVGHVDEARIDAQIRAVDHDGVGRRHDVGTDVLDEAVAQDDRAARDGGACGREDPGALDCVHRLREPGSARRIEREDRHEQRGGLDEDEM